MTALSRIDLNLLVVFDTIFNEASITRAARRLNLTQPAVSHALARLREIFGDPLFNRQGHVMVPTPLARAVVGPIRQALRTIEDTISDCGLFDPAASSRRFTIGLRDTMEAVILPPLLERVARDAPGIDLSSVRVERLDLERDLAVGRYDVVADILIPTSPQVRHTRLATDGLVVVAREGHPAVDHGLTLETYLAQEHIIVTSSQIGLGLADREVARFGEHRKIRLRCQQSFAACRVVSQTDLILTMPARYAHVANLLFGNRIVAAPFSKASQDIYLYWHSNVDADPGNLWLRGELISAFERSTVAAPPRLIPDDPATPED